MKKKGAIELSVSFIVMLIISIAVFSFGIYFVNRLFTHAIGTQLTFDERTSSEIEGLLSEGLKVAIPFEKKTIYNGKFGKFGIGILNVVKNDLQFKTYIWFDAAYDGANELCKGSEIGKSSKSTCGDPNSWLFSSESEGGPLTITKTIKKYEQNKFLLGVNVNDAPKGTYIFNVRVCYNDGNNANNNEVYPTKNCDGEAAAEGTYPDQYDTLHKIRVEVP